MIHPPFKKNQKKSQKQKRLGKKNTKMDLGVVSPTGIGACLLPFDALDSIFCNTAGPGTFIAS
jgi:hypothetical protein